MAYNKTKKSKNLILIVVIVLVCMFVLPFGLTACKALFDVNTSVETSAGKDGKDGKDGEDGKSAYETWLGLGYKGTEEDFIEWLKGEKGPQGDKGEDGANGEDGVGIEDITTSVSVTADGSPCVLFSYKMSDGSIKTLELPFQFKTVNGESILGSGDITVSEGDSTFVVSEKLKGKTFSIVGDSLSAFGGSTQTADGVWTYAGNRTRYPQSNLFTNVESMYWYPLISKYGMKLGVNESWAGSHIYNTQATDSGDSGPNRHMASMTRLEHLDDNGTPDIIILAGGGNDTNAIDSAPAFTPAKPIQFATLTDEIPSNLATLTRAQIEDLDVSNETTAYAAMIVRCNYLYPNAKIYALTPQYTRSYYSAEKLHKHTALIQEICDYFGVTVIDTRKCGMTILNIGSYEPDNIHPNAAGHALIAKALSNALISTYEFYETAEFESSNDSTVKVESTWYVNDGIEDYSAYNLAVNVNAPGFIYSSSTIAESLQNRPINAIRVVENASGTFKLFKTTTLPTTGSVFEGELIEVWRYADLADFAWAKKRVWRLAESISAAGCGIRLVTNCISSYVNIWYNIGNRKLRKERQHENDLRRRCGGNILDVHVGMHSRGRRPGPRPRTFARTP